LGGFTLGKKDLCIKMGGKKRVPGGVGVEKKGVEPDSRGRVSTKWEKTRQTWGNYVEKRREQGLRILRPGTSPLEGVFDQWRGRQPTLKSRESITLALEKEVEKKLKRV